MSLLAFKVIFERDISIFQCVTKTKSPALLFTPLFTAKKSSLYLDVAVVGVLMMLRCCTTPVGGDKM